MLALLPTDGSDPLVKLGEAHEPPTAPDEALIQVEAFSINRGETFLLERPRDGWRPGRDISGRVIRAAALGSGPARGPYDVAFESVGGSSLPQALKLLAKGGRLIWLGQASRMPSQLDFFEFFPQTGATIRHFDHDESAVPDSRQRGAPRRPQEPVTTRQTRR
jgi:NADPH:quinone reductase-like Zn-dependent oxidoreductase